MRGSSSPLNHVVPEKCRKLSPSAFTLPSHHPSPCWGGGPEVLSPWPPGSSYPGALLLAGQVLGSAVGLPRLVCEQSGVPALQAGERLTGAALGKVPSWPHSLRTWGVIRLRRGLPPGEGGLMTGCILYRCALSAFLSSQLSAGDSQRLLTSSFYNGGSWTFKVCNLAWPLGGRREEPFGAQAWTPGNCRNQGG